MSQPPSQTRIFNRAMALLGSTARVTSLATSASPAAKHGLAVWDEVVRALLADHPWNFALKRAELNAGTAPVFGYARSFALPADCLRWLPGQPGDEWFFEAVLEGNTLLSDADAPVMVRYISTAAADEIGAWPPHFADAVVAQLAAELAEPVTQSASIQQAAEQRAAMWLKKAKRRDGQAGGTRRAAAVYAESRWLRARDTPYYSRQR